MSRRSRAREWIAIDFETANERRDSACALGVAVVQDGQIVSHGSTLIRPPELRFEPINVSIHGITEHDVRDAPTFGDVWDDVAQFFEDRIIVAHNAGFDLSVLRHCLDAYSLAYPTTSYFCTVTLARRAWPHLPDHRLDTVAGHIGHTLQHHEAESDAIACAAISLACCEQHSTADLHALATRVGVNPGLLHDGGYTPPSRNSRGPHVWARR